MGIYSRYMFRQAGGAIVLILFTLTIIIWVSVALKDLSSLTSEGRSFMLFMTMTALAMPRMIAVIMPIALLIAAIHTLNKASGDSELIVMTASGARQWRFAGPLLALGAIVMLFNVFMNVYLQPKTQQLLREYLIKARTDLISTVIRPGQFTTPEQGLTFHIRDRARNGTILGLIVHDQREPTQKMSYMAERANIIKQGNRNYLVMNEGHIHRTAEKTNGAQIITFDRYLFDLSNLEQKQGKVSYKPRESYIGELINPPKWNAYYQRKPGKFRAELHDRLSNPLYPILFVLIVVAYLGHARTTRENRGKTMGIAFAVAAGARIGGIAAVNLAAKHDWAAALVYGIPIVGIIACVLSIHYAGLLKLPKIRLPARNAKAASPA